MKIIIAFFIFCLVLFIYLHIQFHLKTSEDLEMYEVEDPSKDKLEEICNIRQPILFDFDCNKIMELTSKSYISNYNSFEIKIRNSKETDPNTELYVLLPLHTAIKLFDKDKKSMYFTENNKEFLEETGMIKSFKYNDEFLRPPMVSNCNYDIMMGSNNVCTPFRYKLNYRNYFILTEGSAQIKLAAPSCVKYLYPIYDYENFEFRSPVDPWNPQIKFKPDFDKIKCLEFTLTPGKTLYIPAYWWYSIKFNNHTSISCFYYKTYMNNVSILPYVCMHALQLQNIKRNVVKKASITELNKEIIQPNENDNETDFNNNNETDFNNNNEVDFNNNNEVDFNNNNETDFNDNIGTNINELPEINNID